MTGGKETKESVGFNKNYYNSKYTDSVANLAAKTQAVNGLHE